MQREVLIILFIGSGETQLHNSLIETNTCVLVTYTRQIDVYCNLPGEGAFVRLDIVLQIIPTLPVLIRIKYSRIQSGPHKSKNEGAC